MEDASIPINASGIYPAASDFMDGSDEGDDQHDDHAISGDEDAEDEIDLHDDETAVGKRAGPSGTVASTAPLGAVASGTIKSSQSKPVKMGEKRGALSDVGPSKKDTKKVKSLSP